MLDLDCNTSSVTAEHYKGPCSTVSISIIR